MANSHEIIEYKQKAMSLIVHNPKIISLIDEPDAEYADDLIGTNLFTYFRNPLTEQEAKTYIFMLVDSRSSKNINNLLKTVIVTFRIVSHVGKMAVPKRVGNRVDLLGAEIDEQFNKKDVFGIGELELVSNEEGFLDNTHPQRIIKFIVEDFDNKRCKK